MGMILSRSLHTFRTATGLRQPIIITGLVVSLLWVALSARSTAANHYFFPRVYTEIERQVEIDMRKQGFTCRGELICGIQLIPTYYKERNYRPLWFDREGLRPAAKSLIHIIEQIYLDGLYPADYHLPAIQQLLDSLNLAHFPPDEALAPIWAQLDLILTDALLLVGAHLTGGRVNPETLHTDWIIPELSVDMLAVLNGVLGDDQLQQSIDRLRPHHRDYIGLQKALRRLRAIEDRGGWPTIADVKSIRPGAHSDQVALIRRRMIMGGDLTAHDTPQDPRLYDDLLVAAVRHFQQRHGLEPDGIVGPDTRRAMNTSVARRIRQIELNLERWRWLPRDLGERYIAVNTAAYDLAVMENDQKVMSMRVVVGKPARMTPVFSARLSDMVLNPYWNVPYKLATEDILPKLAKGAEYLVNQGFKVFSNWEPDAQELDPQSIDWSRYRKSNFPFRLRQEPGKKNALGQVKFMFPNKFAVYLHDTPQRSLFDRFQRGFSSGCIRVEHAQALADYLLSPNSAWTAERLQAGLASGKRQVVPIANPIPIHLLYMTAWVDEKGMIQFRKDIYGRDRDLDRALQRRRTDILPAGITPEIVLQKS